MPGPNILVVAVDGLRASALGAYGNTTFPTPALDRFASESLLLDACFAPSGELSDIYRALWTSQHPLRPKVDASMTGGESTLARWVAEDGYSTTLITDESKLASFPAAARFDECVQIPPATSDRAADVTHTAFARVLANAVNAVDLQTRSPRLIWVHASGMHGPWDAPLDLQQSLLDEDDPPPIDNVAPPDLILTERDDPDTAFRYSCAYAAQMMALDACWEGLMAAIVANISHGDWLVMLLGARGFSLGEHRRIGGVNDRLYVEQVHVPWLIRFPNANGRLSRSGNLVSHFDLAPTIIDSVGQSRPFGDGSDLVDGSSIVPLANDARASLREALVFGDSMSAGAIRTPVWSLLCKHKRDERTPEDQVDADGCELFVRPDDRWEANDIAARCPEIAEGLWRVMNDFSNHLTRGEPMPRDRLPQELLAPIC